MFFWCIGEWARFTLNGTIMQACQNIVEDDDTLCDECWEMQREAHA